MICTAVGCVLVRRHVRMYTNVSIMFCTRICSYMSFIRGGAPEHRIEQIAVLMSLLIEISPLK